MVIEGPSRRAKLLKLASFGSLVIAGGAACASLFTNSDNGTTTTSASQIVVVPGRLPDTMTPASATAVKTVVPAAPASGTANNAFVFGVQTHFSQGWNPSWLQLTSQLGTRTIRDTVNWSQAERTPGSYIFSDSASATLTSHCATGGRLHLTLVPKNPLYDGGHAVYSDQGRATFAAYVTAVLRRFAGCVVAVEVGNELNSGNALDYPSNYDKAATYVALIRRLHDKVKPAFPDVALLGGSVNAIGTGYLEGLFAAGMLPLVDGVAVHPYRSEPEGIDTELAHLNQVMARYGAPKPIWATEYSFNYADQRKEAAALVKSAVQLSSSGVDHANWYALVEQKSFPNMGLFDGTAIRSAGRAFRATTSGVLPFGRPVRIDTGDLPLYLYRIGTDRWVVWGGAARMTFKGAPVVRDMYGAVVSTGPRVTVGDEPRIVEGASGYSVDQSDVFADSLVQWGRAPWSYYRRDGRGTATQLGWFDNDFTSWFGDRWSKPLRINNSSAAPAGTAANPTKAVMRYTAPRALDLMMSACFTKALSGDGVDYAVERNGQRIATGVLTNIARLSGIQVRLDRGDRLDFVFGPNQTSGGDSFSYRIVLASPGSSAKAACPQ